MYVILIIQLYTLRIIFVHSTLVYTADCIRTQYELQPNPDTTCMPFTADGFLTAETLCSADSQGQVSRVRIRGFIVHMFHTILHSVYKANLMI